MAEQLSVHLILGSDVQIEQIAPRLDDMKLRLIAGRSGRSVSIAGDRSALQDLIGGPIQEEVKPVTIGRVSAMAAQYKLAEEPAAPMGEISELITRVITPVTPNYWQTTFVPPTVDYYHLHVPFDIARLLGVQALHAAGITGDGVRVVMIDTGFYSAHPFYNSPFLHGGRNLNVQTHGVLGAPDSDPNLDEYGHGTGIASNLLAVAPGCEFHHIKDDQDPVAAFDLARDLEPHIITCSWGWSESFVDSEFRLNPTGNNALYLRLLEDSINEAIGEGTVVLFASGNGPLPGSWPSSIPDVISVGGALIEENGDLAASSYATSFLSLVYDDRRCPDICGLVGPAPHGLLIMMPTQPNNELDEALSAVDGTQVGDGWLVASGTSSATPQVAGMVALWFEVAGRQSAQQTKTFLQELAVGVEQGTSASGHMASGQRPNLATGYGLVTLRRPGREGGYLLA